MSDLVTSISSVVLRTFPNLLLLLILTQMYDLLQVGDALFAITVCSLLVVFVDYGLNDVFNHRCAAEAPYVKEVFTRFYRVRLVNGLLIYLALLASYPLFTNKDLYLFSIAYFPCSFVFQFQVLAMSSVRYANGFVNERQLQIKLSVINSIAILVIPLLLEITVFHYLLCLSFVRIFLFVLTVIRKDELLRSKSIKPWSFFWHIRFLKKNSGWFMAHGLGMLYLNIDSLILLHFLPEIDFAIYQVAIRFFITITMISMAINAIASKKIAPAVVLGGVYLKEVLIVTICKASALYIVITCAVLAISPFILKYLLAIPAEYTSGAYIYSLAGIFFFRVCSNIFDSIYASLGRADVKLYSHLLSIFSLLIIIYLWIPYSLVDALYVVLSASACGLVSRVGMLLYCIRYSNEVQHG